MARLILALAISLMSGLAWAAESTYPLESMEPNLEDKASLQRGMKLYMNYCMGCHSLKYQRYKRTAQDLDIPQALMLEHLVFDPDTKIGDLMENSISMEDAKNWFGVAPPDLTLESSLRGGPEWIYTYLKTFYVDESRPYGMNNLVFENVAMPHALVELQGLQEMVCKKVPRIADNGGEMRDPLTNEPVTEEKCGDELIERGYSPLKLVEGTGQLTPEEYDQVAYDIANFLYYTADPNRPDRERIGVYVLLFLAFFIVFAWLLNREYWKDIH
ncbi:MAG: cytochrome c1 [Pseudomonadales bacterium]|nr:cytochrome c1 [Pseudomonadales bacterium]